MALIKDKYYRIGRIDVLYMASTYLANVVLEVYDSIEDREKTKTGQEYLVKDWVMESIDLTDEQNLDIRSGAYIKLKELEKYQGAEDV